MANGKAIVDGVGYLAATYAGGDAGEVNVVLNEDRGNNIHVYLENEELKDFTDADVAFMESLGFEHSPFEPDEDDDYSYFFFSLSE